MLVPSIDLLNAHAVQLVGGEDLALDAGDPHPLLEQFGRVGEVAVIDLDAARGEGSNAAIIEGLVRRSPCRVGGGIRDLERARHWLDAGAAKIIIGTAATPELLGALPPERTIAALDARHGEVVVEGWRTRTGRDLVERIGELKDLVGGFLITFVEREGQLVGVDLERCRQLVEAAGPARVTFAGGICTADEIAALDAMGADAQVGMALYTGQLALVDAFSAPLRSDRPDGLWSTVIVDERDQALGLAYSDRASLEAAITRGVGAYHSRRRGLWIKGESSGATQELLGIDVDCDRDALRFRVRQGGPGFCHLKTQTCWGEARGLSALVATISSRIEQAPPGSYTRRLLEDETLLRDKLLEEAQELAEARGREEVTWETADLIYFALVAMVRGGVHLDEVERHLDARALRVTRRG